MISDGHSTGKFAACAITVFTLVQLAFGCAVSSKIVTYDYKFVRFIAWLWGGMSREHFLIVTCSFFGHPLIFPIPSRVSWNLSLCLAGYTRGGGYLDLRDIYVLPQPSRAR